MADTPKDRPTGEAHFQVVRQLEGQLLRVEPGTPGVTLAAKLSDHHLTANLAQDPEGSGKRNGMDRRYAQVLSGFGIIAEGKRRIGRWPPPKRLLSDRDCQIAHSYAGVGVEKTE